MAQIRTLNELYFRSFQEFPKPDAFRHKVDGTYRNVSTEEFSRAGRETALGLVSLGLERGDRVALLSENRLEWSECDLGILTAGLVSVPIYPTLGREAVEYILEDSGARAVFVSSAEQARKVLPLAGRESGLTVVIFESGATAEGALPLAELRSRGAALDRAEPELYRRRAGEVSGEDLATIIYTSGTTGPPKGVMLTHWNIVANVLSSIEAFSIDTTDTALSFLPLSHVLERMAGLYIMVHCGATIAFAESVETVPQNMQEVRPTMMVSVPRLYEKMYARILDAAMNGGPIRKNLFFWARNVGLARARRRLDREPVGAWLDFQFRIARALVFSKLRARTGGRLRFFISGGAPLARDIAEFFYAAGLTILEGYGLTESSPVIAVNTFEYMRLGTVGKPIAGVSVRIAEDGEIVVRGPNVMMGYYNNPEATAAVLVDGWLYTGDIGHIDKDGFLVITDRKKDLIVTAGGKNVAPQPIENRVKTDKFIAEMVVLGDKRPYLVALVVPEFNLLRDYAQFKKIPFDSVEDLVVRPEIREFLMRRIERYQRSAPSFEKIKRIEILDHDLSLESGELTPTLKVKRKVVQERYADRIEKLYASEREG